MKMPWLDTVYTELSNRALRNNLHHGLLLKGQSGIGKKRFARRLSQTLLCKTTDEKPCGECQSCKLFKAQSHPDWHLIQSDKQIGVDLIRDAIQILTSTSQLSGNKVLVIDNADTMTESASNALLKTLEEPTLNTFLLLVTDSPERLLPTILSRCEKVSLPSPSQEQCHQWLISQGYSDVSIDFIQAHSNAPFLILEALQDDQGVSFDEFTRAISDLRSNTKISAELAEKWQKHADKIIQWLQYDLYKNLDNHFRNDAYWQCDQDCKLAVKAITNPGVNKVIILTNLLNRIAKLDR